MKASVSMRPVLMNKTEAAFQLYLKGWAVTV